MKTKPQFLSQTKIAFGFLAPAGFGIVSEYEGTYASFKDGFSVTYSSPLVSITVSYGDMEFDIVFQKEESRASYLFLDHNLFSNASGLSGPMFPIDKLAPVIEDVARDISIHYGGILSGEIRIWTKIKKLRSAPVTPNRHLP